MKITLAPKKQFVETVILISHTTTKSTKITNSSKTTAIVRKEGGANETLRASRDLPGS